VDRQVRADELLLFVETQAHARLELAVDDRAARQRDDDPHSVPAICEPRATPPNPPSAKVPKMPAAMPPHAPQTPCSGHTPSTSSIRNQFCV
jgi:hypothetical protein